MPAPRVRAVRAGPAAERPAARPRGRARAPSLVAVPSELEVSFSRAERYVRRYFGERVDDPERGTISISGERYVLVRAAALSVEFVDLVTSLFRERAPEDASRIAQSLLFDLAHSLGKADARALHERMGVVHPVDRFAGGPVHFAFSGWGIVELLPESNVAASDDYLLVYDHPHSFEADSWARVGRRSDEPVCVMNAGYSSGWCEESFGLSLVAVEIECAAAGGERCRFVMAPPSRIGEHLDRLDHRADGKALRVPEFFEHARRAEELQKSHESLEQRVAERTAEVTRANELLRAEIAERCRAEAARDEFLSIAAHELKTPLTSVLGFAQLLARRVKRGMPLEPASLLGPLAAIESQSGKLARLVGQLLDLSRLQSGQLAIDRTETDLGALVGDVVRREQMTTDRHELVWSGPRHALADVDPLRIEQVLTNLVDNAIKFSPAGGRIEIDLSATEGAAVVRVTDHGVGIAPEMRSRLFERPQRHDARDYRRGLGLGLFISQCIVLLHGGSLRAEHPDEGGTTMIVRLPRGAEPAPNGEAP